MASFKFRGNGKVQITITRGKRYDGTPCRYHKEVTYISDKQLNEEAALFLAEIVSGKVTAGDATTLDVLYNNYIQRASSELKMSTAARYKTLYKNQIKDHLGQRRINSITRVDIKDWVKNLSTNARNHRTGKPLAPKTIQNALSLLSTLYTYAIEDLDIVDKNPCDHIKVPKAKKKYKIKHDFYKDHEVADLILCLLGEAESAPTHVTALLLFLFTGMRTGEVMGLRWEDIDMSHGLIKIERERMVLPGMGIVEDTPKTDESERLITLPTFMVDLLQKLRSYQIDCKNKLGNEYHESGYVITAPTGNPSYPRNSYDWFKRFQVRYGLKPSTIHDLRHTHAAMLSSIGVQIADVSKRLGHSNTRITQEVYEYYFTDSDNGISDKLSDYFKNVVKM